MGRIVVIMGAPGAGKGTQSRLLSDKYGYPQISTGDILREMSQAETPLGQELRTILASGNLVSDQVLAEVILERTSRTDCASGYILDGFPRTLKQAELLEDLAGRQGHSVMLVRVTVHKDTLLKRLTGRRLCPVCGEIYNVYFKPPKQEGACDLDGAALSQRVDDNEEKVGTRLQAYIESTTPLFDYYGKSGRLVAVDGERPVEEIFNDLSNLLPVTEA
ncbi:MAG: adenylate kinase [Acidobacteria bacterium]|nr:adenylate kinase [Acidobacteriota bacterium]MBI3424349.1 adenylate kinase [Acidobacteriota bacterium]